MDRAVLTTDEIADRLRTLDPGWSGTSAELRRTVEFPSFRTAIDFLDLMAPIAERMDHHPDVALSWRTVRLTLTTHSSGGVTHADLALAAELDAVITPLTSGS
jgi:4a-hydroxytetrahydrobiopterin dehydratase